MGHPINNMKDTTSLGTYFYLVIIHITLRISQHLQIFLLLNKYLEILKFGTIIEPFL